MTFKERILELSPLPTGTFKEHIMAIEVGTSDGSTCSEVNLELEKVNLQVDFSESELSVTPENETYEVGVEKSDLSIGVNQNTYEVKLK